MPTASERQFATFRRGEIRDNVILESFRNSLATIINPHTGAAYAADEIARATQPGSTKYIEADAMDLALQANQARAAWLADQQIPSRAASTFLEWFHGRRWLGDDPRLPATGGSGEVSAAGTPGSIFPGSTTMGDPTAAVATDPNGYTYQVTEEVTVGSSGVATLPMKCIDTGASTNPAADTVFTWSANAPLGASPTASVTNNGFSGGYDQETDAELAARIEERMRYRPASGNPAHFLAWAREASAGVEYAFVYASALNPGSVLVCVVAKRGNLVGPDARIVPGNTVMADATNYLTPPGSPVVPKDVFAVVTQANAQDVDIALRLSLGFGINGGWLDSTPWPNPDDDSSYLESAVTTVNSQTEFEIETDSDLPGGVSPLSGDNAPGLMLWHNATSRFVQLSVASVSKSGTTATITLNTEPPDVVIDSTSYDVTIAVGDRLSPYTDQHQAAAEAIEGYFDGLGPGEVVDLASRPIGARGGRFPAPNEKYPCRAGQAMVYRVVDALGNVSPDAHLSYVSKSEPDLPGEIIDGPNMLTLGHVTLLPLE